MACTVSYNIFDSKHLVPVSVVVTYNEKGQIRLDYVRIIQKDESRETFKIYDAKIIKEVTAYIEYSCNIISDNRLKEIRLTYFLSEHVWCIDK